MTRPWYQLDGDRLLPTGVATGPIPTSQHGSAVAGVIARAVDAVPSPVPMDIVRLTVDLSRPVVFGATEVATTVRRAGKRVQVVDATLSVDGVVVGRSEGLRMRRGDNIIDPALIPAGTPPVFDRSQHMPEPPWQNSVILDTMDISFEHFGDGRARYWIRLAEQLVAGETMTPATRAAVAADMVLTGGKAYPGYTSLNADLTMSLHRLPVGEWFRLDSSIYVNSGGWGTSVGQMYDLEGLFGHVTKSVLYEAGTFD